MAVVWVLGPTCSGKTLLIRGLKSILGCDVIHTGQLIRDSYPPKRISQFDIPDTEIFELIRKGMEGISTNLILLDNYPVSKTQLDLWYKYFAPPKIIFHLQTDEETLNKRRLGRGRFDDNEIYFSYRKHQYEFDTVPVIVYMEERGTVCPLDSTLSPKKVMTIAYKQIREKYIETKTSYCDNTVLNIERHSESAKLPSKAYPFSAAFDLFLTQSIILPAHKTETHTIGISLNIPARAVGIITGRSSISSLGVLIHQGVIDPSFSSPLKIIISNLTSTPAFIDHHKAIAQILLLPNYCPRILEATTLKLDRGSFGSSDQ